MKVLNAFDFTSVLTITQVGYILPFSGVFAATCRIKIDALAQPK